MVRREESALQGLWAISTSQPTYWLAAHSGGIRDDKSSALIPTTATQKSQDGGHSAKGTAATRTASPGIWVHRTCPWTVGSTRQWNASSHLGTFILRTWECGRGRGWNARDWQTRPVSRFNLGMKRRLSRTKSRRH